MIIKLCKILEPVWMILLGEIKKGVSMAIFSRMKTKKDAMILALVCSITDGTKTSILGKRLKFHEDEFSTLHIERIFLDCLALDVAANIFFESNTREKSNVLDKFYDKLYEHYYGINPKAIGFFKSSLSERLDVYSRLIRSHENSDLHVANAFAKLCEKDNDSDLIKSMQIYFIKQVKSFREIFSQQY